MMVGRRVFIFVVAIMTLHRDWGGLAQRTERVRRLSSIAKSWLGTIYNVCVSCREILGWLYTTGME